MKLTGTQLSLRAIEPGDIDLLYAWENDTRFWKVSNTLVPYSRQVLAHYLETAQLDIYSTKQLRLLIDELPNVVNNLSQPKAVGCIDLFDFDPLHLRAGVGILIASEQDRRKGHASEALELLINYSFEHLHLHQLYCNIEVTNDASILLFKKHGFEITGVKKHWIREGNSYADELLLQLIKR
ncbi:MAG TPA: GNAT family protein [Bacteroidia bacterium]|nr:GNAT family protein [Bacteroidia bacterium]HRG51440.1 GNAT family protein [Bacteroidia bacterium]